MTDREMLEWAAKAAGFVPVVFVGPGCIFRETDADDSQGFYWNPLQSDGDALRLAVKLKLDIEFDAEAQYPHHVLVEQYDLGLGFREDLLDDPLAATRLAIVRAASEIGRGVT